MPLPVAAFLSSLALWVAENIGTATGTWIYSGQVIGQTKKALIPRSADNFHFFAEIAAHMDGESFQSDTGHGIGIAVSRLICECPITPPETPVSKSPRKTF